MDRWVYAVAAEAAWGPQGYGYSMSNHLHMLYISVLPLSYNGNVPRASAATGVGVG